MSDIFPDPINMGRRMGPLSQKFRSSVSEDEAHCLQELAKGKNVLEIGSWTGHSAYRMAFSASRVDCVDPYTDPGGPRPEEFIQNTNMYDNIFLHIGRSADMVPLFQPIFDLVFIDGDHSFEGCRLDLELALSKVYYGGTIALHDYNLPDEYVERLKDSKFSQEEGASSGIGIKKALADFFRVHCNFMMVRSHPQYNPDIPFESITEEATYEFRPPKLNIVDTLAYFMVNWKE